MVQHRKTRKKFSIKDLAGRYLYEETSIGAIASGSGKSVIFHALTDFDKHGNGTI